MRSSIHSVCWCIPYTAPLSCMHSAVSCVPLLLLWSTPLCSLGGWCYVACCQFGSMQCRGLKLIPGMHCVHGCVWYCVGMSRESFPIQIIQSTCMSGIATPRYSIHFGPIPEAALYGAPSLAETILNIPWPCVCICNDLLDMRCQSTSVTVVVL